MKYLRKFESIDNNTKDKLDSILSKLTYYIRDEWNDIKNREIPMYLIEFSNLIDTLDSDLVNSEKFQRHLYNVSLKHHLLEDYIQDITTRIEKGELNKLYSIKRFNGENMVYEKDGYKLFRIDRFEEIDGFDSSSAICVHKRYFDLYNKNGVIHYLFKDDTCIYTFSVSREDYDLAVIVSPGGIVHRINEIKNNDPTAYNIMKNTQKSLSGVLDILSDINTGIIKEFWEWSKNSYGQDKSNTEAQSTLVDFNTRHGYGTEGQWVRTQDGDVYIEEIGNGRYKGFDRNGDPKTGSTNDIIRTLIKKEVIKESKGVYKYGCLMLYFDPNLPIFSDIQKMIDENDVYYGKEEGKFGRDSEPHITILYGLHSDISDSQIESIIDNFTQPNVVLNTISIFENDEFDVVKFDINNTDIVEMNRVITKLPHTTDYPDYKPHLTISYVKKGTGKKYIQKLSESIRIKPTKIVYSKSDGTKLEYNFNR